MRKQVYPYAYFTSFERFEETDLPPREAFYSSLTRECVSEIDRRGGPVVIASAS